MGSRPDQGAPIVGLAYDLCAKLYEHVNRFPRAQRTLAFMGHADIQTTMIYVHHVPQHNAAERLSKVVAQGGDFAGLSGSGETDGEPFARSRPTDASGP